MDSKLALIDEFLNQDKLLQAQKLLNELLAELNLYLQESEGN